MNSIEIDSRQLKNLSIFLKNSPEVKPFHFCDSELFPAAGDPDTVDFFFYATLHQFGFWYDDGRKYLKPMYGTINSKRYKGSDFFWRATLRAKTEEPHFFKPEFRATLKLSDFASFYREDSGQCPLPMLKTHWRLAVCCAQDLLKKKLTPQKILEQSNETANSLQTFLKLAGKIPGYKEDPLKKKLMLLAVIYAQRPEKFLTPSSPLKRGVAAGRGVWSPIVDYHVQRTALRTGLVKITNSKLSEKIIARKLLSKKEEGGIRTAVFNAMQELGKISGKSAAALDWLFFNARKKCPEMTEPDCSHCILDPVCAKRKKLFQPVFRTTYY